jgi:hypothetical protein
MMFIGSRYIGGLTHDRHGAHSHPVRPHPMLGAMEKPGATTRAGSVPRALPGAVSITDRLKEGGRHDPHPAV